MNKNDSENIKENIKVWKCPDCGETWVELVPVFAIGPKGEVDNAPVVPKLQAFRVKCSSCGKFVMINGVTKLETKGNILTPGVGGSVGGKRFKFPM